MATMHRRYFHGNWTTRGRLIGGSWGEGGRGVYRLYVHHQFSALFRGVLTLALLVVWLEEACRCNIQMKM